MKISTKVEFGIIALVDIAINSQNGKAVNIYSISNRQGISGKYLERILSDLRRANLIKGLKGSKGGYVVAKPQNKITFKDIIDALDVGILSDVNFDDVLESSALKNTVNECLWSKMNEYLKTFAQNITLEDMVQKCREAESESYMYYI